MSWRGEEGGIAAVTSGHRAVMTPGAYCYLDSYQDAPYSQPEAIGGYLPLKKVYSYDPVSVSLTTEQAKLVYGVQGNLWVEYIPTPEQVEYMMYPRILALAEVAWSAPERKSWRDFHARALKAVRELQAKGYHPFDLKNEIGSRPESVKPVAHLALSKKVIYNSSYSPHYPAQGKRRVRRCFCMSLSQSLSLTMEPILRNWNTGLLKSPKKFLSNLRTSHGRGMLQEDTFAIRLKPEKNSEAGYSQMR